MTKIRHELGEELLTGTFLALLGAAWLLVFLPATFRARQASPFSTAERFRMRMDLISPRSTTGRWVVVPKSYEELARASFQRGQRRRKRILLMLVALVLGSAIAAWARGGSFWEIHLMADASLALYVSLLLEAKKRRIERKTKVRRIQRHRTSSEMRFDAPMEAGGRNS